MAGCRLTSCARRGRWRKNRAQQQQNGRLKRIVADLTVQIDILKAINAKEWRARPASDVRHDTPCQAVRAGPRRCVVRWSLRAVRLLPGGEGQRGGEAPTGPHREAEP